MKLSQELHRSDSVFFVPLGGLGEIGMNLMAVVHKGRAMVIDCGVTFPDSYLPGVDLIMPRVEFFHDHQIVVQGLVLTHSHEDHLGSVQYLYDILGSPPIHATEFTLAMLTPRLREVNLLDEDKLNLIKPAKKFKVGVFELEPLRVTHSLVDCIGLAIQTPSGMVVHTGDFKIDKNPIDKWEFDEKRFREIGDQGVQLFMSDSTNAESPGWSVSESELQESMLKIISEIKSGKVIVTLFSSNIHRIQILMDIAKKVGRRVLLCGRSVISNTELAIANGHLNVDRSILLNSRDVEDTDPEKIMVLATGTQAEGRSALYKMSARTHPDVDIDPGDTVIFSSRNIPGNEKRISFLVNNIYRCGADVIDFRDGLVHVSGHARQEELKTMIDWVRPRYFLPVHGEYSMLCNHFDLVKEKNPNIQGCVAENGEVLELGKDFFKKHPERVTAGKVFLDEARNTISEETVRLRRKLGHQGFVMVNVVVKKKNCQLVVGPELIALGLPEDFDYKEVESALKEVVSEYKGQEDVDFESLEEEIRLTTRRFFRRAIGLKPQVIPAVYAI